MQLITNDDYDAYPFFSIGAVRAVQTALLFLISKFIMGRAHHGQLILFKTSNFDQINKTIFVFVLKF